MVVWLHINLPWGMPVATEGINLALLHIIEVVSVPAVDIFIIISGYFMANKRERSIGKPLQLLLQLILLNSLFFFPKFFYNYPKEPFEFVFLPNDYFITLYISLYFISPYINKILDGLTTEQFKTLFVVSAILFCIYPILWEYMNLYTGSHVSGVSTVSRWNNDSGNNIVTFAFLYLLGALINKVQIDKIINKRKAIIVWLITTFILLAMYILDKHFTSEIFGSVSLFYHSPWVIIQAVTLFLIFKNMKFSSRIINRYASAALTCYIIQRHMLRYLRIESFLQGNPLMLIMYYIVVAIVIYFAAYLIYLLYNLLTKNIFKKFNSVSIKYY